MAFDSETEAIVLTGRFHSPGISATVPATLRLYLGRLSLVLLETPLGGTAAALPPGEFTAKDIRVEPKLGMIDRKLYLPGGGLFETSDSDGVERIFGETFWSRLHRFERFSPILIGVGAACIALVFLIWQNGLPWAAQTAAALTPKSYVQLADAGTLKSLDLTIFDPSDLDGDRQTRIQDEFQDLLSVLPPAQRRHNYRLLFRSAPAIGPNALAMPGGTIVVTDQLVEAFEDDAVVVAVLGHEIGHVAERHSLRQLYRAAGMALFIGIIIGDVGPVLEELVVEANLLQSLRHSRAFESDADLFAVDLLKRAGRDPRELIRFFEYVEAEYGLSGNEPNSSHQLSTYLSTHPLTQKRIEAIRRAAE